MQDYLRGENLMLIFVCCAIAAEDEDKYLSAVIWENQQKAYDFTKKILEMGYAPLTPQLYLPKYSDKAMLEDKCLKAAVMQMIKNCDEMWVFGSLLTGAMKLQLQCAVDNCINLKFIF
jgi:hypothetical protein